MDRRQCKRNPESSTLRTRLYASGFEGLGDRLDGWSILPGRERWIMVQVYTTGSASKALDRRGYLSR
jgi:hypothetical protein